MSHFEIRPPFIVFHDDKPGSHATLFGPNGARLHFRGDVSVFNDKESAYAWAFEGEVADGSTIVFATADREVVGKVRGKEVVIDTSQGGILRGDDDKPLDLTGDLLPPVEELLKPPHYEEVQRPVQMTRGR